MLEIDDEKLDHVRKAVIDAVINDPDLDVAALNYHLQGLGLGSVIEDLKGEEMKSRLSFDPHALVAQKAIVQLEELLGLLDGKSGLFSKTHTTRM